MKAVYRWIYDRLPIVGQNAICTLAGQVRNWQRYDRQFQIKYNFFRQSRLWDLQEAEGYQLLQLRDLLKYCTDRVPFYGNYSAKFKQTKILQTIEDWRQLNSLNKDDVRRAGISLVSTDFHPNRLVVSQSGGSTGMPLRCYHNIEALKQVYALFWAAQRPGVTRQDKYATFQGLEIIPVRQKGGPYWRMNHAMNQRLYSIFHLSEMTIGHYLADLDTYKPTYIAGYANSLYLLATLVEEMGLRPSHAPKAIFTTSEQLLPTYRETIERVFRTRVWDAYSQDETCGSITQYDCGFYHYDRAYGYMEFEDVQILPNNRRLAEIICTGFLNRAWPLLRYRPGDLVEYEPAESCFKCGRAGPIIHAIRGRTGDILVLPSGRRFPHISLLVKDLKGIRHVQLEQHAIDRITIRYVPNEGFRGAIDEKQMINVFARSVNEPIVWKTEAVSELPRTAGGKFMSIISRMPRHSDNSSSRNNSVVS